MAKTRLCMPAPRPTFASIPDNINKFQANRIFKLFNRLSRISLILLAYDARCATIIGPSRLAGGGVGVLKPSEVISAGQIDSDKWDGSLNLSRSQQFLLSNAV